MKQSVGDVEATVESSDRGIDNNTPKRAIPGTPSSETLSGGETEDLTQLPKMDIAGLEHVDFVRQFKLVHSQPTNFGLSPNNIVTIPAYIKDILADQELATRGSPMNNALVKCRVETIILTTLANIKCHAGSCRELQSLNVQFDREIHLPWKLNRKIFNLSGTVDYSLWDGKPSERVTDTVVVKTETTPWLKRGMYNCLIYMAMIHHTRKRAGMPDTSIFGVATDGFEWVFIRIRPDNHYATKSYQWVTESVEIVSMLFKIFNHAAGISISSTHQRWMQKNRSSVSLERSEGAAPWRRRSRT